MDFLHLPDARLRVQARQRDLAAEVLREAVADGRLSVEELRARLSSALDAHTREDLYRVLFDLVPEQDLPRIIAEAATVLGEGEGMRWETPLIIRAGWQGHTTRDFWDLPPFVEVIGTGYGVVTLDCTLARPLATVIDIVITGNPGVVIVVPQGWGVDVQQLNISGASGSINSQVPTRPLDKNPRLILRGSTTMSVKVREPTRWDLRRLAKAQQNRAAITDGR